MNVYGKCQTPRVEFDLDYVQNMGNWIFFLIPWIYTHKSLYIDKVIEVWLTGMTIIALWISTSKLSRSIRYFIEMYYLCVKPWEVLKYT